MIIIHIQQEDQTDISDWTVSATCINCGQEVQAIREDCWLSDDGVTLYTDCLCSEADDPDRRSPMMHSMTAHANTGPSSRETQPCRR